jgi:hypothetical protein
MYIKIEEHKLNPAQDMLIKHNKIKIVQQHRVQI